MLLYKKTLRCVAIFISLVLYAAFTGFLVAPAARAQDPIPDLSGLSFTAAFDSLCVHYSTYYAFSDWKAVDWSALYSLYAPEVQYAEAAADTGRFKLALKRFVSSFPDGHVRLRGDMEGLYEADIGGGYGLTLAELSDARIAVDRVITGGPAAAAGIEVGAIISSWDGSPVASALDAADVTWEGNPPATVEGNRLSRLHRLVRAPVGQVAELTFANPGQGSVTVYLTAQDDSMKTWELGRFTVFDIDGKPVFTPEQIDEPVRYEILPSGIGYLRSSILADLDENGDVTGGIDSLVSALNQAVTAFNAASVRGVIVDIRDNPGGFDRLAAVFGGLFYDHVELYEHASFYDDVTETFVVVPQFTLYLEPQASYFGGPVVCLVNAGTASSAEGVAMAVQRLPLGYVMGFHGTHGSFGLVGGESALPAGIGVQFPLGRSLDAGFGIQIDSDHNMIGGIVPDHRIPITVDTVKRKFNDGVDVELEQAEAFLVSITPVRLSAFVARREGRSAVLTWRVAAPSGNGRFHVWRQEGGSARIQLTTEPIGGRREFRFVDVEAPVGESTYWLEDDTADGRNDWLGSVVLPAVEPTTLTPTLHYSRPNPFTRDTLIPVDVREAGYVTLTVYDLQGRVVRKLRDGKLDAGSYVFEWDGRNDDGHPVSSGVYFYKLTAGKFHDVRKVTLLR